MAKLTAAEMHYEVRLIYESIYSGDAAGFTKREWSELLTLAQTKELHEVIKSGKLDSDEYNKRVVSALLDHSSASGTDITEHTYDNTYIVVVPSASHILSKHGKLTESTQSLLKIVPHSHDFYITNLNNVYKTPFVDDNIKEGELWELNFGKVGVDRTTLIVVPENTTLNMVYFNYLKQPEPIIIPNVYTTGTIEGKVLADNPNGIDCVLDGIIHRNIVETAANLAAAYTREKDRYQLQKSESEK